MKEPGKRCKCGAVYTNPAAYARHLGKCASVMAASAETSRLAAQALEDQPASKRPRLSAPVCCMLIVGGESSDAASPGMVNVFQDDDTEG